MKKLFVIFAFGAIGVGANAQAVKVNSVGNVGIGTNNPNPAYKLTTSGGISATHVAVAFNISGIKYGGSSDFTYDQKSICNSSLGWYSDSWNTGSSPTLWLSSYGGMKFFTGSTPRMAILGNGNVGIGIDNPTEKLHINGGVLKIGNGTSQNDRNINMIKIGDGDYVKIGEWEKDDWLSFYASGYSFATCGTGCSKFRIVSGGSVMNIYSDLSTIFFRNWETYAWNTIYAQDFIKQSDSSLKENILPLENSIDILKKIKTYSYHFKAQPIETRKRDYGVLAQEIESVLPDLVYTIEDEKFVSYMGFIPILIDGFNEQQELIEKQQAQIESLQQESETLRNALLACCSNKKGQKNMQEFELTNPTDIEKLKVFQNTPNPFTETTIISCYIPESVQKAELCVYDMQGGLIKCLGIAERGITNVQIQAGQLAAGIYTYILMGDGKTSDAKQMILTK